MQQQVEQLRGAFAAAVAGLQDEKSLEAFRIQYLGRKGILAGLFKQLGGSSPEDRPAVGKAIHGFQQEVETALAAESILVERAAALESATRNALAARDLAEQRYRAGLSDIITVLSSQRTALDSESALLSVRRARLDNRVDLHLALGGGFTAASPVPSIAADSPTE